MKLSAKRQTALYKAIADEIQNYRLAVLRERRETFTPERVEKDLFYLTNRVWSNVEKALGIKP